MASRATPSGFWSSAAAGRSQAVFAAEGIRCAGCARTIERAVSALPGIERVSVNAATARVSVGWRESEVDLPSVLDAVEKAGFKPLPLAGAAAEEAFRRERRAALKRIGLAGLGTMQAMMYVFGLYVSEPHGMDPALEDYLRWVGLLIATPVLLYSGAPFFRGAWGNLRGRTLGMDVPVALALALAYAASVFNTLRGAGQTYFDSVTMFVFFLSAGRYLEMIVRQRSLSTSEALARSLPASVTRLREDDTTERISAQQIAAGDRLSIPKGAVIPVDASLLSAQALVDESLVTGESTPILRRAGEALPGGAVNAGASISVRALRDLGSSTLASIVGLLERAQSARPRLASTADRTASWFVGALLLVAAGVALAWLAVDPARAFPATLAVLVVTCPCALSLATPAAVAAATARLARLGLLVTRADAIERLAHVDTIVIDKTGTLTGGTACASVAQTSRACDASRALALAAALERHSDHPLALAFAPHADPGVIAGDVTEYEGRGIEGSIGGRRWRLGRADFVLECAGAADSRNADDTRAEPGDALCLGDASDIFATFEVGEQARPEAAAALEALRSLGLRIVIASGDRVETVQRLARSLGIEHAHGRLDPAQKIELVRGLQREGHRVLMIGDGVNDGPVLAAADVSCAMGQGSAIAQAAADLLLLNDSLAVLARAVATARRTLAVIRQNLRWSLVYNFSAVPLAALDFVPPWLAAIGMSASSLLVVLNARRLAHDPRGSPTPAPQPDKGRRGDERQAYA
jgi:Cu2+-exporting ATPase